MSDQSKVFVDIENTRSPEQKVWYQRIIDEGVDPFEEDYFKKNHPKPILFKNTNWLVTKNAVPYKGFEFHFLLVPRFFIRELESMSEMTWLDFQKAIHWVKKEFNLDGHILFIRTGDTKKTGASVIRLHAHILVPAGEPEDRVAVYPVVSKK